MFVLSKPEKRRDTRLRQGCLLLRGYPRRSYRQRSHQTSSGVVSIGQVSKDQLERARQIPVLDYVLRYEPDNAKRVGNEYRLRDHDSLSVGTKGWYWHSQGIGGKSALDYLTTVRGYGLVDAVCLLLNEHPHGMERFDHPINRPARFSTQPVTKQAPERLPFATPLRNRNNSRVIAYLQKSSPIRI